MSNKTTMKKKPKIKQKRSKMAKGLIYLWLNMKNK